jgi:archaellum component FlaC
MNFNRDIGKMIMQECRQSSLGDVKIEDFSDKYSKALTALKERNNTFKNEMARVAKENENLKKRLQEVGTLDDKRPNSEILSYEEAASILFATVGEVHGLKLKPESHVCVEILVDSVSLKTRAVKTGEPKFLEMLAFDVLPATKYIVVSVLRSERGDMSGKDLIGSCEFNVSELSQMDQRRKVFHVELVDKKQNPVGVQVALSLQLAKSYREQVEAEAKLLELSRDNIRHSNDQSLEYLEALVSPFPFIAQQDPT